MFNGDPFRWRDLWPEIARWFALEPVLVPEGVAVQRYLEDKGPVWDALVTEHGLTPNPLTSLVSDGFLDKSMAIDWDAIYDMSKAQGAGFTSLPAPLDTFTDLFETLRKDKVIP